MPKVKPEAREEPQPLLPALQKLRLSAACKPPTQLANHPHSKWESLSIGFPTCNSYRRKTDQRDPGHSSAEQTGIGARILKSDFETKSLFVITLPTPVICIALYS